MNGVRPLAHFSALPLTGEVLLQASAGTGKTWQIALLYLRLLLEHGADVEQILVCTFTRDAAAELRGRLRQRLRDAERWLKMPEPAHADPLARWLAERTATDPALATLWRQRARLARLRFDRAPVGTIQRFCAQVLEQTPFASGDGFRAAEPVDEAALLDEVYDDFRRQVLQAPPAQRPPWASALLTRAAELRRALGTLTHNPDAVRLLPAPAAASTATPPAAALTEAQRRQLQVLLQPGWLRAGSRPAKRLRALLDDQPVAAGEWLDLRPEAVRKSCGRLLPEQTWAALLDTLGALAAEREARATAAAEPAERALAEALAAADPWCAAQLKRRLDERRQSSYTAQIDRVLTAVAHGALAKELGERYPHILIDEFQDTDQRQYAIFAALHAAARHRHPHASLHLVGDPKQAIYGFRGGDLAAYQRAAAQPGLSRWSLAINQRSSDSLVAALNALYAADPQGGFADPLVRYVPVGCGGGVAGRPLQLTGMPVARGLTIHVDCGEPLSLSELEDRALADCAERIARLLEDGNYSIGTEPVAPGDIAVLLHQNRQIERMRLHLVRHGVPCVGPGRSSVLATDGAEELELLLHALLTPGDEAAQRAALATRLLGFDLPALRALDADRSAFERELKRLDTWQQRFLAAGPLAVVESLLDERGAALLAEPDGERVLTDVRHLGELLQALAASAAGPQQVLARFRRLRREPALVAGDEVQQRLESDARRVQLKTLHGSKGLQFPLVFLPLAWRPDGLPPSKLAPRFHDLTGQLCFDLGSPALATNAATAEAERQAEQLRLLYVALTRAEHAVWLHWSDRYSRPPGGPAGMLDRLLAAIGGAGGARAGLERLRTLDGHIAVVDGYVTGSTSFRSAAADPAATTLLPPPALPKVRPAYAVHSFSSLTSEARGLDAGPQPALDESRLEQVLADVPAALPAIEATHPALSELAALRGNRLGNVAHTVLELATPGLPIWPGQAALIGRQLRAHGFVSLDDPRDPRVALLGPWLERVRCADLGEGRSLAGLDAHAQAREFTFHLPLAGAVDAARLRRIAAQHGWPDLVPPALRHGQLRGLLTGAIDLVACWHGRYYVVDYKTNRLGEQLSAYAPTALRGAVAAAHYDLQALLYTVALHRYLRQQLPDYRPDRHLGGTLLLFLRALGLDASAGRCEWRFDDALVLAIDAALAQEPAAMERRA